MRAVWASFNLSYRMVHRITFHSDAGGDDMLLCTRDLMDREDTVKNRRRVG
jgi:hypothetical protein